MKEIRLTRGLVTQVDDEDFQYLNQWKWYASKTKNTFYAARDDSERVTVFMHRLILNITGVLVCDHRDRNGLNNQRSNIRVATVSQNMSNRASFKNSSSKYLGVSWVTSRKKWIAQIFKNGKRFNLGRFDSEGDAALAYNSKATELHGEFANLNVITT